MQAHVYYFVILLYRKYGYCSSWCKYKYI